MRVLREESKLKKSRKIVLPLCVDLNNLECTYPKTQENTPHHITEKELLEKVHKVRSKTPRASHIHGSINFGKQSDRRFIPLPPAADSRFEVINRFPRISSKSSHPPSVNFSKYTSRKEASPDCSPGPCQYSDGVAKSSKILYGFDMKKLTGRKYTEGFSYDTVDPDKVSRAIRKLQMNSKAVVPDFGKVTDRYSKSPESRKHDHDFD